jgi:hypothetical protein
MHCDGSIVSSIYNSKQERKASNDSIQNLKILLADTQADMTAHASVSIMPLEEEDGVEKMITLIQNRKASIKSLKEFADCVRLNCVKNTTEISKLNATHHALTSKKCQLLKRQEKEETANKAIIHKLQEETNFNERYLKQLLSNNQNLAQDLTNLAYNIEEKKQDLYRLSSENMRRLTSLKNSARQYESILRNTSIQKVNYNISLKFKENGHTRNQKQIKNKCAFLTQLISTPK